MKNDWLGKAIRKAYEQGGAEALADPRLLRLAVSFNRLDLVLYLLGRGVNPNGVDCRGRSPLFYAASRRMVRVLMEAGARVNQLDQAGHSALHAAAKRGRKDVAHALLGHGIDLHAQDRRGMTALHAAAMRGRTQVIEQLLAQGAWANVRDRQGRSPLFFAVAGGHLKAALALIEHGADLTMIDDAGTPWLRLARMDQVAVLQTTMDRVLREEEERDWMPSSPNTLSGRLAASGFKGRGDWSGVLLEPTPGRLRGLHLSR